MKAMRFNMKRKAFLSLLIAVMLVSSALMSTAGVFAEGETAGAETTPGESATQTESGTDGTAGDTATGETSGNTSGDTANGETGTDASPAQDGNATPEADSETTPETPVQQEPVVTLEKDTFTYNGQLKEPLVIVKNSLGEEIPSGCYDVLYKNNTEVGTATATVYFNKNAEDYGITGYKEVNFKIEKCALTKKNTVFTNKIAYNGKTKKVKLYYYDEVTEKKIKLTEGTDFTVKVAGKKKLKEMGIYTVRLTGKGSFRGYIRSKFYITPKAVRSLAEKSRTAKTISIKWKAPKSCEVDGYVVCYTDSKGKYVKKKTTKLQYKVACNEAFYVSADVYSYKVVGKKTIKSAASKNFYGGLKPVGTPKFTLTEGWDSFKVKPEKEGDYQVYVSYEKGFDNGTVKDSKWYFNGENPLSVNVDSSEHGKTWWVKIRQYTEVDGAIRMGEFTEPVRVTVY